MQMSERKKAVVRVIAVILVAAGTLLVASTAYAPPPPGPLGIITHVGNGTISLKIDNGQAVAYKINDATVVHVNGQAAKAADLKAGMKARVIGVIFHPISPGDLVTEIRAYTPQPATSALWGTITEVGRGGLSLKLGNGQVVAVKTNKGTVVSVNGQVAKAADIKAGMKATVISVVGPGLAPGGTATEIRAHSPKT